MAVAALVEAVVVSVVVIAAASVAVAVREVAEVWRIALSRVAVVFLSPKTDCSQKVVVAVVLPVAVLAVVLEV